MIRINLLSVAALSAIAGAAHAQELPVPREQLTPEAKLWLARALVAEAGWDGETDHAALAWVLARRWEAIRKTHAKISFAAVVRRYCTALRPGTVVLKWRQRWLRSLPDGPLTGWLSHYSEQWQSIREFVEEWSEGAIPDPCGGLAHHFGGPMDKTPRHWRQLECGPTRNQYYATAVQP